ncbi:hypothetical protein [Pseudoalteromonas phage Pq0]|uniref:hypothetical protein n=1 Tax=Pseudoalteromonas phage Pq0 TaxID=1667322 RepID=UPI0006554604|nr:hypothetical protein AXI74_gp35 [Pseudoalteromonas phage Pq0]AKN44318.1 hypothetical protein [Pseudoalteromonas phage Pq0]
MRWIKHDSDANQDAKLQNVLLDYGLEGYGLYWYCIELIAGKVDKDNITFELEHDARIIARNVGSTAQKVEEMMRYFVELGLFENSQGTITCLKLAKRLDKSMTSNPEMRSIIESFKNHDSIMTKSEKPMQDKIRLDKNNNIDQSKIDREKFILEAFDYWWKGYPKKQAKAAAFKSWQKVTKKMDDEKVRALTNHIFDDCKLRLESLANGETKFIGFDNMNATTYLNQERYNDDV